DHPEEHDHDRDHRGQHGPVDGDGADVHASWGSGCKARGWGQWRTGLGFTVHSSPFPFSVALPCRSAGRTGMPSRTASSALVITVSPGCTLLISCTSFSVRSPISTRTLSAFPLRMIITFCP